MNRIFNVIWSKTKEQWIVVSERVKTNGGVPKSPLRSLATLAAMLLMDNPLFALDPGTLPSGGQITTGSGTIAVGGDRMTVNQSSPQMIANWNSFNIGSNAAVQFNQPNSTSSALNRINDQNPSQIMGSLSANGRVFLVNPSGIIFGKTARIDAGAITASSLNMLDSDFLAGRYSFSNSGNAGMVINQGVLNAMPGGVVALIGPKVSNEGTITTPTGSAVLAAGNQVSIDFEGDGLINLTVDQAAVDALAENKGLVKADGGLVVMTARAADALTQQVLSNSGVLEAITFVERDGRIILDGGESGITQSTGTITAKGVHSGETGGSVVMTGNKVGLFGSATVDVSGAAGGGRVNIGGGFQGKESSIQNASATVIDTDVNISADALSTGNGGKVVVWSNDHTAFGGSISARGGCTFGDGGFVEVSSKGVLDFVGLVDACAANGKAGSLLLDPKNIIVATGGGAVLTANMLAFETNAGGDSIIAPSAITGATGSVTLQANNDITVTNNITRISATGHLTLKAGRTITNNAIITIGSNALTLIANAGTAAGVIDANREPGAASIINNGTITLVDPINSTGTVNMTLDAGTGQTYHETDSIFTGTVTAKTFNITHNGPTAGGTITVTGNLTSTGLTFNKPVTVTANNLALNAQTGILTFTDTLNANTNNLTLIGDDVSIAKNVSGTGTLIIQPSTTNRTIGLAGGLEDFTLDGTELGYLQDGFSAITIGNSTAGRVTIGNTAMSYHDPLTIKTGNSIFFSTASSLTGNNNALTLWSRAGGSNAAADGVMGSVWMPVGSSVNSGGGAIVIGGGSDPSSGYALGDNDEGSSEGNARYRGVTLNGTLTASGGSLTISGKGNASTNARGVSIGGTVTTDGSGTITINGIAKGSSAGIALGDSALGGSSVGVVSTADGNIALTGIRNTTGYGIQLETAGSNIQTTGSGNAVLTARGAILSAGTLTIGGTTTLTAETADPVTRYNITASNAANNFTGAVTFVGNTVSISDTNALTLGASTALGNLTLMTNGAITQSGAVSVAGTTDITAGSTNNITLNNASNDFTGGIRLISGNDLSLHDVNGIVLGNANGGITASGNLSVIGSEVTVNKAINAGSAVTITTDAIALNANISGTGNLTIAPKSDTITIGVAGGTGALNLDATEWGHLADGFATVTLGSATAGALNIGNSLTFNDSTILRSGSGVTVPQAIAIGGGYLSIGAAGASSISGVISGGGYLETTGSGVLSLAASSPNSYTGQTVIGAAATLRVVGDGALGSTSAVRNSGVLDLSASNGVTTNTVTGSGEVNLGAQPLTLTAADGTLTGVISGTGGSLVLNGGSLTLSGTNTYSGTTSLSTGSSMTIKNSQALGLSSAGTTVASGAALLLDGTSGSLTVAELLTLSGTGLSNGGALRNIAGDNTVSGAITLGSGNIIIADDAGNMTFTGTIDGSADLQLNNSGTLTFDAAIGSATPLATLTATGGSLSLHDVTTVGNQTYTGMSTITVGSGGISSTGGGTIDMRTSTGNIVLDGGVSVTGAGNILLAAAQNFINHKGADALATESGRWLVYSTDPRNDIRGNLVPQFKLYNATTNTDLPSATAGVKGFIYTLAPVITPRLTGTVEKQYDQTTVATLTTSNYDATTGAIDGDVVTLNNPVTGTYDSRNAGTGKTVTVSGLAIASVTDGATAVYGYALDPTALSEPIGIVTKAPLTVSGLVAEDKLYDGTVTANLSTATATLNGVFTGDDISLESATALFDTKNAGTSKPVEATITLFGDDALNYAYNTTQTISATIAKARLTISAIGSDKPYDGTDSAVVTLTNNHTSVNENFTLTYGSANFSTPNAASLPQAISVTGITLVGVDAANYEFNTTAQTSAFINPKTLTATITAPDKVYDGTDTATPTLTITDGLVNGESVTATGTATFNSKNVPDANLVTLNSISLANGAGGLASNYSLVTGQTVAARIIPASLQIIANDDTVHYTGIPYSGGNGFLYTGFINGENSTVLDGTLTYGGSSQGANDCGTYTLSLSGQTGSNYTISFVDGTVEILPVPLTPVLPELISPSLNNDLLTNAPPLLDLGSSSGERNLQSFVPEIERSSNGITVQMVSSPTTPSTGLISVTIPQEMLRSESVFTITLPSEVIGSITAMLQPEEVCLLGGASLPNWIQYNCTTKTFSIHHAPEEAFPMTVQVSLGEKSWTMVISKKNS